MREAQRARGEESESESLVANFRPIDLWGQEVAQSGVMRSERQRKQQQQLRRAAKHNGRRLRRGREGKSGALLVGLEPLAC